MSEDETDRSAAGTHGTIRPLVMRVNGHRWAELSMMMNEQTYRLINTCDALLTLYHVFAQPLAILAMTWSHSSNNSSHPSPSSVCPTLGLNCSETLSISFQLPLITTHIKRFAEFDSGRRSIEPDCLS